MQEALAGLSPEARDAFARAFAERAATLGLDYRGEGGTVPIPVAFPPVIEPRDRTRARARLAHAIVDSLAAAARRILDGALGTRLADDLLAELTPFEREIVERRFRQIERLATVRVDLLVDEAGHDRILEVNATIPAMQGYSDIAARALVETALERLGGKAEGAEAILGANGSNAADLLASLLAYYRADGGAQERPSIALLHRDGDSQLGELQYLAATFRAAGHDARTIVADRLGFDARGRVAIDGFAPDILYRHVFAQRVDPGGALAAVLREPEGHHLYNPVDPHLEQKSMLAELSAAAVEPSLSLRLGLQPNRAALVRHHVPWTRRLRPGRATAEDGSRVADLVRHVAQEPKRYVLKRSWDYGGKAVFIGATHGDESSRKRSRDRFGTELSWARLVDACAQEGGWVVQERVAFGASERWLATPDGARRRELFVDVSAYTSLGVDAIPTGGVCRASASRIVNIQSGGGVVPLLSAEAADLLAARIR